jgi:hypothetical protein
VQGGAGRVAPGRVGRVHVSPGADRAGVHTHPVVQRFVSHVAGVFGHPLTIGTGTNHSKFTASGSVSDHWAGNAADVPLVGTPLIHAGRAALIAAGMSPARARRIHGGLFNVGHWQIIFNTNGPGIGDHTTHLHVGFSPSR